MCHDGRCRRRWRPCPRFARLWPTDDGSAGATRRSRVPKGRGRRRDARDGRHAPRRWRARTLQTRQVKERRAERGHAGRCWRCQRSACRARSRTCAATRSRISKRHAADRRRQCSRTSAVSAAVSATSVTAASHCISELGGKLATKECGARSAIRPFTASNGRLFAQSGLDFHAVLRGSRRVEQRRRRHPFPGPTVQHECVAAGRVERPWKKLRGFAFFASAPLLTANRFGKDLDSDPRQHSPPRSWSWPRLRPTSSSLQ